MSVQIQLRFLSMNKQYILTTNYFSWITFSGTCYTFQQQLRLVSLVGKVPAYRAGGLGTIPGRTNTQGLKIIEEKVLPLL